MSDFDEYDLVYSSCDEDFNEEPNSSTEDIEIPTISTTNEQCPFQFVTMDYIVHDVLEVVEQVHSFIGVSQLYYYNKYYYLYSFFYHQNVPILETTVQLKCENTKKRVSLE